MQVDPAPSLVVAGGAERPDLSFEHAARVGGARLPAGLDEVGRGALAGPVVAAAVVLPDDESVVEALAEVRDSKALRPALRARLASRIREASLASAVGSASPGEIDLLGIARANELAMCRALAALGLTADFLLVDGYRNRLDGRPQRAIVRGDRRSLSIAAASVLAKASRDAWMIALSRRHPLYGFDGHKGYGTAAHRIAIRAWGTCPAHRHSWDLTGLDPDQPALPGFGGADVGISGAHRLGGRAGQHLGRLWPAGREGAEA